MSNRKSPEGTFWRGETLFGRAQVRGRDHRWSLRTDDPIVARRRLKEDREKLLADAHYGDARRSFDEVLAAWAGYIKDAVSPKTATRYASSLDQIKPWLRGKDILDIGGAVISEIISGRKQADGVTNATIKRDLVALSSVMNYAFDQGWIENNPVLPRMRRLKERRDPIVLPEMADIQRAIDLAPGMFASLIDVAWRLGCRLDELAKAKRSHLDHARKQITVIGKGNKIRVIDAEPFGAYEILKALPAAIGSAPLFWHGKVKPYRNLSSRFSTLNLRLGKAHSDFRPFRFHDMRHYHAVEWLKAGRSIYDLQHRLGHTSVKTTEVYLKYLTSAEQSIVKQGGDWHKSRHIENKSDEATAIKP